MSNAIHYREQARRLLEWAHRSPDDKAAQQFMRRAREMLTLAEREVGDTPPEPGPPSMYIPRKHRHGAARRTPGL
jgi:hypothetical protein